MRSLVYFIACTVDGYVAARDGSFDFFGFEGPQVPDLLAEFPEMIPAHGRDTFGELGPNQRFDTVLMGRRTYEVGLPIGVRSPYPHLRQIVVSSTMTEPPDPAVELIRGGVVEHVRALKAEPGADIWLCGAAGLAASLAAEIDEVILKINPIVLGAGIPLFASQIGPRALDVTEFRTYPNGFALVRGRLVPPQVRPAA
jgi:dihydrofolate reductase